MSRSLNRAELIGHLGKDIEVRFTPSGKPAEKPKHYGIADRAWQPVVGCDPHMPCALRCWARKTVARVVECQRSVSPERAEFFQIALSVDKQKWSGEVSLDEQHLLDPLKWRKDALVATGFHGDLFRLTHPEISQVFQVIEEARQHRFLLLTKVPVSAAEFAHDCSWPVLQNVSIGCSVMTQQYANNMREPMRWLAAHGWNTHVWYEPALGPVNWKGWEFLRGIIAGGESGKDSRPSHPQWFRDTRDWCVEHRIPFNFKQRGDWSPECEGYCRISKQRYSHETFAWGKDGQKYNPLNPAPDDFPQMMYRVGKKAAGRLLDGRTWDGIPQFGERA
jgi:protein gp37